MAGQLPDRTALPTPGGAPDARAAQDELDRMYDLHGAAVERWVRRLGGPRAAVEDLVHDVFVIALRRRRTFRGDSAVATWLFGITHHVVRRRRWRDRLRAWLGVRYGAEDGTAAEPPTPLAEVERAQEVARLYRALDRLPDSYRTTLVLFDLEGLPAEEVGGMLGLAPNAVWVRVHRGRAKLLKELERQARPAPRGTADGARVSVLRRRKGAQL
jgi:RNA polymerase sigma-70 factor (ECF subfamily)